MYIACSSCFFIYIMMVCFHICCHLTFEAVNFFIYDIEKYFHVHYVIIAFLNTLLIKFVCVRMKEENKKVFSLMN